MVSYGIMKLVAVTELSTPDASKPVFFNQMK